MCRMPRSCAACLELGVRREPPGSTTLVYVLDEPTTGLHLADVEQLLVLLGRLVDAGKSVIIVEHYRAVMAHADWIIDVGPGAGHDGRIMFEGNPPSAASTSRPTSAPDRSPSGTCPPSPSTFHRSPSPRRSW
jgi:excinuclease UvrABC ATPase subunit